MPPSQNNPWNSEGPEDVFRGYSGRVFLLIAFGMFTANLGRQALPPLLPAIIESLSITPATAGAALTIMRIGFAIFQYPSGRVADAVSRTTAIVIGLTGLAIGFTILTAVSTYWTFILGTLLLGVGFAFYSVSSRVLLSDLFVAKRGRAFGINSAISRMGSILAAGLAILVLSHARWNIAFVPVIVLLIGLLVAFHSTSREPYRIGEFGAITRPGEQIRETVSRVFGNPQVRWLVVSYTLVIFAWEGAISFLPAYLQATKDFSPEFASGGFAVLFAVGIVVQPLSGTISDRWDRRIVAGVATILSFLGITGLLVAENIALIVACIGLYAAGLMAYTPVLQAYLMDIFPDESKGGDLGAFKTIYEGLSSLGPTYVGVVAVTANYTIAFSGFLLCLGISAGLLFYLYYSQA